jgi:hypothetical protein
MYETHMYHWIHRTEEESKALEKQGLVAGSSGNRYKILRDTMWLNTM